MNLSNLETLVSAGESQGLELKKSTAEKDRACRSLCAMANMPRASYQRLLMEGLHATNRWETLPAAGSIADDLDARELVVTVEESIRRGRMEDPGTREPTELLRGLGLLVQGDQLSRAAVALFCKDDVSLPEFPQFSLRVARFKGTTRDEFLDNRQYAGNAFALMRRAERFLIDWLPVAGKIVPGQLARIDTPALPTEALREALANAFIHRDYASAAGAVAVALYDDRLEVISPGELHFGFTPAMLFQPHESKPWNPWIAKVFHRRGLIETWGRGTLKIAGLMQEADLQPPTVTVRGDCVALTFWLAHSLGGGSEKTPGKTPGKTPDLVLARLQEVPQASIPELAVYLEKSESAIERTIRKLREERRLARIGPAKGGYWKVMEGALK
jgi:ATP-dependent DNA helicase RecG